VTDPLALDLDHVLAHTRGLWDEFRGGRLFITGGTGFFGRWLLESLLGANEQLGLGASAVVLTRNPEAFARKAPRLAAHPALHFHQGDVCSFTFPAGPFAAVIHAATESSTTLNAEDPLAMLDTTVQGTRRVLDFALQSGAKQVLLTSSGAVYGRQPPDLMHFPEDYRGAPDPADVRSAYGEGKRVAEYLCTVYHRRHGLQTKIARCFAFVGPFLPLDVHFAVGNFLRDGLRGGPIQVGGDGTPYRSYLHAADLMIWLWTILLRGTPGRPYNVGSDDAVRIADLAHLVARLFDTQVCIAKTPTAGQPAERYVPSTDRARAELGLTTLIPLEEALQRTVAWHRATLPPIMN
jgi:nucleoside-diphosphate-sugar epimerase